MSFTKQLSFATRVAVSEAEGEPELQNLLTGKINLRVRVKSRVCIIFDKLTHVVS